MRGPCVVLLMVQLYTERIKLQIEVYNSDIGTRLNTHFPRKTVTRDLGSSVSFLTDVPRLVTRVHCYKSSPAKSGIKEKRESLSA